MPGSAAAGTASIQKATKTQEISIEVAKEQAPRAPWSLKAKLALGSAFVVVVTTSIAVPLVVLRSQATVPAWKTHNSKWTSEMADQGLVNPVTINGNEVTHSVYIPGNESWGMPGLNMTATATIADNATIFSLDHEPSVEDVGCFDGMLHLKLAHHEVPSSIFPGAILTGSHFWGCAPRDLDPIPNNTNASSRFHVIMHRITAIADKAAERATVSLHVEQVHMLDLFKHLSLTYHNHLPSEITRLYETNGSSVEETVETEEPAAGSPPSTPPGGGSSGSGTTTGSSGRRRLGWWSRLKHHVDDAVHKIGHDVDTAAHKLGTDIKTAAHKLGDDVHQVGQDIEHLGDFNVDTVKTLKTFKWQPPSTVEIGPVKATGSYAALSVGCKVEFEAHDFSLETAEIAAELTADLKGRASVTLSNLAWTKTWSKTIIPSDSLGTINFAIGPVPVHISADVGMDLKAQLKASETIDIDTWARATRTATFGVQYAKHHGWSGVHEVASPVFTHEAPTFHATGTAEAKLYLDPTLSLNVDFIGGPSVGVTPYVDLKFTAQEDYNSGGGLFNGNVNGCSGVEGVLGWGLGVDVGAALSLKLPGLLKALDHTFAHWGPQTVYTMPEHDIYSTCIL